MIMLFNQIKIYRKIELKRLPLIIFSCILLFGFSSSYAAINTSDSDNYFKQGISAFKQNLYETALSSFNKAKQAGMDDAQLHYNIGVCHYKLKNYSGARDAFLQTARTPSMKAIAHYNLGLVYDKMGSHKKAQSLYTSAASETTDKKLRKLSERKLGNKNKTADKRTVSSNSWFSNVTLSGGYDDNLIDPTDQSGIASGDGYYSLSGMTSGTVAGTARNGIKVSLNAYFKRNNSISIYDLDIFGGGISKTMPIGSWATEVGLLLDKTILGSNDYLRTGTLLVSGKYKLDHNNRLKISYRYSDLSSLSTIYDQVEGDRHRFDVKYQRKMNETRLELSYRLELNDRKDARSGSTFTSYSPTRNQIQASLTHPLAENLEITGGLVFRNSSYNDPNILADSSTITRDDDRSQAKLRLRYKLDKRWSIQGNYSYTDNSSNITSSSYSQNLSSLGITGSF